MLDWPPATVVILQQARLQYPPPIVDHVPKALFWNPPPIVENLPAFTLVGLTVHPFTNVPPVELLPTPPLTVAPNAQISLTEWQTELKLPPPIEPYAWLLSDW